MACVGQLLNEDIEGAPCGSEFVAGLDSNAKAVLINFDDVMTKTRDAASGQVTALALKTGTEGYDFESIKRLASKEFGLTSEDTRPDGYVHTFTGIMTNPTAGNLAQIDRLKNGSRVIVVVKNQWKGSTSSMEESFTVLGFDRGLILTSFSQAPDGAPTFVLATEEAIELEGSPPSPLWTTDLETTTTSFNNSFAAS